DGHQWIHSRERHDSGGFFAAIERVVKGDIAEATQNSRGERDGGAFAGIARRGRFAEERKDSDNWEHPERAEGLALGGREGVPYWAEEDGPVAQETRASRDHATHARMGRLLR